MITLHINSGICKCGCSWEDHHLGCIVNWDVITKIKLWYEENYPNDRYDGVNGYPLYVPQECERYGCNEYGGKKYNEETDEYEDHCHQYEDKDGPLAIINFNGKI